MSRQLLLSGHTIRCDVGYGLAAGDGERVAVTPVAVSNAALGGVRLVVGDRCAGLVATVDSMPPKAGCRRCMVHFLRNVLSKVPPTHREWASAALKAVFAMESREIRVGQGRDRRRGDGGQEADGRRQPPAGGDRRDHDLPAARVPGRAPQAHPHERHVLWAGFAGLAVLLGFGVV